MVKVTKKSKMPVGTVMAKIIKISVISFLLDRRLSGISCREILFGHALYQ